MTCSGEDMLVVFNNPEGRVVLGYLIESYIEGSSYITGDSHETACNEGKRMVVRGVIDLMRMADPGMTAQMLCDIEMDRVKRKPKKDDN